jgi:hypothetical protein
MSTARTNVSSDNEQAEIGTASGLGRFKLALVGLWLGWKQYRCVKATKSLSSESTPPQRFSQDAGSTNTHPQLIQTITSNPNNLSTTINMPPSDTETLRNLEVGPAEDAELPTTNISSH